MTYFNRHSIDVWSDSLLEIIQADKYGFYSELCKVDALGMVQKGSGEWRK